MIEVKTDGTIVRTYNNGCEVHTGAVCTWGDGPDVSLYQMCLKHPQGRLKPSYMDLSIEEAEHLLHQLMNAIVEAKTISEGYRLYAAANNGDEEIEILELDKQ